MQQWTLWRKDDLISRDSTLIVSVHAVIPAPPQVLEKGPAHVALVHLLPGTRKSPTGLILSQLLLDIRKGSHEGQISHAWGHRLMHLPHWWDRVSGCCRFSLHTGFNTTKAPTTLADVPLPCTVFTQAVIQGSLRTRPLSEAHVKRWGYNHSWAPGQGN